MKTLTIDEACSVARAWNERSEVHVTVMVGGEPYRTVVVPPQPSPTTSTDPVEYADIFDSEGWMESTRVDGAIRQLTDRLATLEDAVGVNGPVEHEQNNIEALSCELHDVTMLDMPALTDRLLRLEQWRDSVLPLLEDVRFAQAMRDMLRQARGDEHTAAEDHFGGGPMEHG